MLFKNQLTLKRIITGLSLFSELSIYIIIYHLWNDGLTVVPFIVLIENTLMILYTIKIQYDIERECRNENE